jgi:NAD(P)-dependent dehydrogenase (short-subunit alcohol dehydrogenase family)
MEKTIIITGTSSGIGFALAEHYLKHDYFVLGTVRKDKDCEELMRYKNFTKVLYDLSDKENITQFDNQVNKWLSGKHLFALINNAGIAVAGPLQHVSEEDFYRQMEINLFAQRRITNICLQYMYDNSRIIMMSSVSGLFNNPFTGPYCISKHALESMTDIYRRELALFNIKVIALEPGPIKTPIWGKSKGSLTQFYNTKYGSIMKKADKMIENAEKNALEVSEICKVCDKALLDQNPSTRYVIHKKKYLLKFITQFLPDKIVDRIVAKTIKSGDKHRNF